MKAQGTITQEQRRVAALAAAGLLQVDRDIRRAEALEAAEFMGGRVEDFLNDEPAGLNLQALG